MLRTSACILALTLIIASIIFIHPQEKRIALVLHNNSSFEALWKTSESTKTPDINLTLSKLGFHVTEHFMSDQQELAQVIRKFAEDIKKADVALLYYTGQMAQMSGRNYLIPSDAISMSPSQLEFKAVAVDPLLHEMQRLTKTNFIFLNACRYQFHIPATDPKCYGLAPLKSQKGMMIAYANEPHNNTQIVKESQHAFAQALLTNMMQEDVPISTLMSNIRSEVVAKTEAKQLPWVDNGLKQRVVLNLKNIDALQHFAPKPKIASWIPTAQSLTQKLQSQKPKKEISFHKSYMSLLTGKQLKVRALRTPLPSTREIIAPFTKYDSGDIIDPNLNARDIKKQLQTQLREFGCYHGAIDGIWGRQSRAALRQFGHILHLNIPAKAKPSLKMLQLASSYYGAICNPKAIIKEVQTRLAKLECYPAKIDGVWGRLSKRALRNFKQNTGLKTPSQNHVYRKPSIPLIHLMRQYAGPICGPTCGVQKRQNKVGLCVAIQKPKTADVQLARLKHKTARDTTPVLTKKAKYTKAKRKKSAKKISRKVKNNRLKRTALKRKSTRQPRQKARLAKRQNRYDNLVFSYKMNDL